MRVLFARGSRKTHLLTGAYLSGIVLAITTIALMDNTRYRFLPDPNIIFGIIAMITGIAFAVAARLERPWVPFVAVPFGVVATLASALYSIASNPGQLGTCTITYVRRGFPVAWNATYNYAGSRCYLLSLPYPNPRMYTFSFTLDVLFYVAIGLAIVQILRGIIGKTTTAQPARDNSIVVVEERG